MSEENVNETPVEASAPPEAGGAGEKPVESTKPATLPKSVEEMSEEQKAIWMQGAKDYKAYVEREEAKKAAEKKQARVNDNDDPTVPVEREIENLVNQALAEAGDGATGQKVLVKSLTKLLVAQTNMTKQMAEEIAEKKVAAIAARNEDRDARDFYAEHKLGPNQEAKLRDFIKNTRVNAYDLMDLIETIRPQPKGGDDIDDEYERVPKKPRDIDDYSFLETPTKRGESAPAKDPGKMAADLAKKAVEAEKAGNIKDRDKYLNQYIRASRRLRVA